MIPDELSKTLERYSFYHVIDLGDGIFTPGIRQLMPLQAPVITEIRRADLQEKRVLDIGCRDGLFSFEAEQRGGRVLGIDTNLSLAATEFLIPWLKSSVEMRALNIYDLHVTPEERFDYVIFAGVLYHLRLPFAALKRIVDAMNPGGALLIETALMLNHRLHPFVYVPAPKDSPYEPSSVTFFNHLGLVSALESMGLEDVECRAVIAPSAGHPCYGSWKAFLESSDGALTDSKEIVVGRATYLCRRSPGGPSDGQKMLDGYWYGADPRFHGPEFSDRLRKQFGFARFDEAVSRAFSRVSDSTSASPRRRLRRPNPSEAGRPADAAADLSERLLGYKQDGLSFRLEDAGRNGSLSGLQEKEAAILRLHAACTDLQDQLQEKEAVIQRLHAACTDLQDQLQEKEAVIQGLHAATQNSSQLRTLARNVARKLLRRRGA